MGAAPTSDKESRCRTDSNNLVAFPYELFWAMKFSPLLICTLLVVSISPALDVSAVQVTGEPFSYTETLHKSAANAKPHDVQKRANGKVQAGYFSNW